MRVRALCGLMAMLSLTACDWRTDCCREDPQAEAIAAAEAVEAMQAADREARAGENSSEAGASENAAATELPSPDYRIVPVRYGIDGPEWDSCGSYGEVSGLNPRGDNFLSVRAMPSTSGHELDRLNPGQGVWFCDGKEGWIGIVYDKSGELECGAGSPIDSARAYNGPCKSGWVSERFVTLLAG